MKTPQCRFPFFFSDTRMHPVETPALQKTKARRFRCWHQLGDQTWPHNHQRSGLEPAHRTQWQRHNPQPVNQRSVEWKHSPSCKVCLSGVATYCGVLFQMNERTLVAQEVDFFLWTFILIAIPMSFRQSGELKHSSLTQN